MQPLLRIWPLLLLTGCAQMPSLLQDASAPVNENSPGVSITQSKPPRLAALTFYAKTPYSQDQAMQCAEQLMQPQSSDEPVIRYAGRDMLNASGIISNNTRLYGVLPVQDYIRYELTLLEKVSGTTYHFRRIELSRFDPMGINSQHYAALPPSGSKTELVHQQLEALFKEMDACIAGSNKSPLS